jgi:hypothetical protein
LFRPGVFPQKTPKQIVMPALVPPAARAPGEAAAPEPGTGIINTAGKNRRPANSGAAATVA